MLLFDRFYLYFYFKMQNTLENPDVHAQRQPGHIYHWSCHFFLTSNTSSYWYCLTKRKVDTSQICQDIIQWDYRAGPRQVHNTCNMSGPTWWLFWTGTCCTNWNGGQTEGTRPGLVTWRMHCKLSLSGNVHRLFDILVSGGEIYSGAELTSWAFQACLFYCKWCILYIGGHH